MASVVFRAALALTLVPPALAAQTASPAARRAHELVSLIDQATPAAIEAYVDSAFGGRMREMPMEAHQNFFMGQHDQTGGLEWIEARNATPTAATAVVKSRLTGEIMAIGVQVDAQSPYRIAGIGRQPPPPDLAAKAVVTSDADLATQLARYVDQLAAADVFSGAVLVAHGGKVVFEKAYGVANKDFNAPNTLETKFNLGSMNKMFTSVAIAQLVEQGKVSYDDPLSKYLPGFPNPEAARKIKIKHLLSHTSGLGSYFNEKFDRSSRALFKTVDQMLTLAEGDSLAFEPGTRWSYSNTGMLVLGKVIEVASGESYFDYIREHVYGPAGMTHSDSYLLDEVNPNLAVGYEKEHEPDGRVRYHNNLYMHVIRGGPAGGGYSTVGDLLRFAEALTAGRLVSPASYQLLTSPKPELSSPSYGYGFGVDSETGIVGHSGGFPGISSNLDIFKGTGWVAAVQSNYSGGAQPVVQKIRELVRARGTGPTP